MDLSKAYDCIPHELLIAKLEAYDLHENNLNLFPDYHCGRKQRTKIGSVFCEWKIICGILQRSILSPLLFNIFISEYKLRALQRIRNYLSTEKARLLATDYINSQFYYGPLTWMFAGKTLISKVQKIHFRAFQEVYSTYEKSYNELLILN